MLRNITALLASVGMLTACTSTKEFVDESFVLTDSIDAGFSPLSSSQEWHTGDEAIFRVEVDDSSGTTSLYVRIHLIPSPGSRGSSPAMVSYTLTYTTGDPPTELKDELSSAVLNFGVEVYDESGKFRRASTASVPESFLKQGFATVCETHLNHPRDASGELIAITDRAQLREYAHGMFSLLSLLQIVGNNEALTPILWKVFDRPSLLSMVLKGGNVKISIKDVDDSPAQVAHAYPPPVGSVDGFVTPLLLAINDKPGLRVKLGVCDPMPPFLITGGIVKAEGVHATRPERRIRLEMVASRIGTGERLFQTRGD